MMRLSVTPLSPAIGAEVAGIDLGGELCDEVIAQIRRALLEHCVLFFRDQSLDVDQHKRLARCFGEIFIHPNYYTGDHDPEIVTISRKPGDKVIVGRDWHTDMTMIESPPMGALLYAMEVPPYDGDTAFTNQYLAYEGLSNGMKALLNGLRCVHTDRKVAGPKSRFSGHNHSADVRLDENWRETVSVHPVACTHPETGRKCLFASHSYSVAFEGMTEEESAPLLDWLMRAGHRPELTCRFVGKMDRLPSGITAASNILLSMTFARMSG